VANQNFRVKNGLEVGTGVTISGGIVTATSFSGNFSGNAASSTYATTAGIATYASTAGVSTNVIGGIGSITQLQVSGVTTFQNNVYLGDNDFIYFGDSGDLYIGYNGSVSAIADAGTGDLYIAGDNSLIITDLSYAENKAIFNTNGSVELYYDSVKTFETLGTGVTITGTTFSNQLSISGVATASSFVRSGGTSSQFLKADGSIDSNTYLTSYTETDTLNSVTNRGNSTSNGISVGVITATSVRDSSGNVRSVPQNSQGSAYILALADVGKHISITTGGVTVNSGIFSAGDAVSIYNNSGGNQTITQGTSVTMYLAGTATTGNRTLAQRGICTVLCVASNTFVIFGAGLT
jgi:hypothetical protein